MPSNEELRMADEFLRLRGSSLKKAIGRIINAIPENPLCLCFNGMRFKQEVLDTIAVWDEPLTKEDYETLKMMRETQEGR